MRFFPPFLPPLLESTVENFIAFHAAVHLVFLLNFLFTRGPSPLAPFRECGPDPTIDDLTCLSFEGCE